jgi:hypothetical protein
MNHNPEHCPECGLLGSVALEAEQTVAQLVLARVVRHPVCSHVAMYRSGGLGPIPPLVAAYGTEMPT